MTSATLCSKRPAETTAISSKRASESKLKFKVAISPEAIVMVLVVVLRPINEQVISWVPLARARVYLPSMSLEAPLDPEVMYAPITACLSEEVIEPETVWAFAPKERRKKQVKTSKLDTLGIGFNVCIYLSKYILEELLTSGR